MAHIDELRRLTGEADPEDSDFRDEYLQIVLDRNSDSLNASARDIWLEKAAKYAELVDITEAGSSRRNSVLHKQAMEMAKHFDSLVIDAVSALAAPFTTAIERL